MPEGSVRVFITTHYDSIGSQQIESVDFLKAVEIGIAEKYTILEGKNRTQDYFFVFLGFVQIDEFYMSVSGHNGL
jgi:hypothetical protein